MQMLLLNVIRFHITPKFAYTTFRMNETAQDTYHATQFTADGIALHLVRYHTSRHRIDFDEIDLHRRMIVSSNDTRR
jgi:hypothetical protein